MYNNTDSQLLNITTDIVQTTFSNEHCNGSVISYVLKQMTTSVSIAELSSVTIYCINRYGNTVGRYGPQSHAAARLQRVHSEVRRSPEGHRPGRVSYAHGGGRYHL